MTNHPASAPLRFTKMHGCGNDFVVIDATQQPFTPSPGLLHRLTDRRFGVGCDQVLVVQAPSAPETDFDYRIFNADGSEVGQCGNGARALAVFIRTQGLSRQTRLRVQTRTARMTLHQQADGRVQVDMGAPRFAAPDLPAVPPDRPQRVLDIPGFGPVTLGVANLGNPHAVLRVDDVDTAPVAALGAAIQARRDVFAEGVNVGFLQVRDRQHGRLRVFERGVGETLACGSGACAAHAVARRMDWFDETATLAMTGGPLTLRWQGDGTPVWMTGPAEIVFTGEIAWQ